MPSRTDLGTGPVACFNVVVAFGWEVWEFWIEKADVRPGFVFNFPKDFSHQYCLGYMGRYRTTEDYLPRLGSKGGTGMSTSFTRTRLPSGFGRALRGISYSLLMFVLMLFVAVCAFCAVMFTRLVVLLFERLFSNTPAHSKYNERSLNACFERFMKRAGITYALARFDSHVDRLIDIRRQ